MVFKLAIADPGIGKTGENMAGVGSNQKSYRGACGNGIPPKC